jgi:hypothetical protein
LHGPLADPDQSLLKTNPAILGKAHDATQWRRYESPTSCINLGAVLTPNDHVVAIARCVLVATYHRLAPTSGTSPMLAVGAQT